MFMGFCRSRFSIANVAILAFVCVAFAVSGASGQVIQSDDFHSTSLDPRWQLVDPVGDAALVSSGTNLIIHVPGGVSHSLWTSCNCAPRVLQSAANTDFEIEAKFDSKPSLRYQMQGFVVHEDGDTYLRFDVHHDGASARIFAGYQDGVNPGVSKINLALPGVPSYLRVTRAGGTWTYKYSLDGTTWTTAGSFTRGMVVTQVGLFAGNSNTIEYTTPDFVANIDYFFNTASPIVPEDGGDPTAPTPPVVDVWYGDVQSFGHLGTPQQWVNIVGTVWDTDAITSLSYSLNLGPSTPLTIGPDGFRLVGKGDFNVEIDYADLSPGTNELVITALDVLGHTRVHTVTIDYTDGAMWELPYTAAFSTASAISDVAQVVDGRWFLTGDGVRVDSSATGYDRFLTIGERTWSPNYEVTAPFIIHAGDLGGAFGVGVGLGWQGHTGTQQPRRSRPYQAFAKILDFPLNPTLVLKDNSLVRAQKSVSVQAGVQYVMKVRSQSVGVGLARVAVKLWEDGTPEPTSWDLTYDFTARYGSTILAADYAEATFGDVSVVPLPPLGIKSDDFSSAELNTELWNFINPLDDATLRLSGTNVIVYVPGGIKHNFASTGNFAPRLMQNAPDTDFETEIKFGSVGHYTYQGQGLIVQEDSDTYLRFEVIYTSGNPALYAGYFDAGVLTTKRQITVPAAPSHIRVSRTGDHWVFDYSYDGTSWTFVHAFDQTLAVTEAGVYFNNTTSAVDPWSTPAFVGNVDYFFNTGDRIFPEDGGVPTAATPPVVDVWYGNEQNFGQLGMTQQWVNIVGTVWDTDGMSSLSYSLNGGSSFPLNMGPDGFRLVGLGDYNVEIDDNDLNPGVNELTITAVDAIGEQTDHVVTINYADGITWEMPYLADWLSATELTDVAHVGDGRWILTDDGVRTAPNGAGYDRFLLMGDKTWEADYEVTVPMTIHTDIMSGATGAGVCIGWQGHVDAIAAQSIVDQPRGELRYQTIAWVRNFPANPVLQLRDDESVRGEVSVSIQPNVAYMLKARSETTAPGVSHVSVKLWLQGTPEPTNWMLSGDFASHRGSVSLIAHLADVTFGNVAIMEGPSFPLYVLTTTVLEGGSIVRLPDYAAYYDSSKVKLTAVADEGWTFDGWSGGLTGSANPATVMMVRDTSVTAQFERKAFSVRIWVAGNGSVLVDPVATQYLYGDKIELTAVPQPGYYFWGWYGDHSGSANPDTVTVTGNMMITGMFFAEITGIDSPPAIKTLTVVQNSPNPFARETHFNVGLPKTADVEINVYDVSGRRVFSTRIPSATAGWNRFLFAGNDQSGKPLPSGVYFYRVRTQQASVTNRMVIIR
jgi:regulation of enolase protein 1 (concanavalin A-like superfamily)